MVPGIPGYIPLRERTLNRWTKADGSDLPDWWEIMSKWAGVNGYGTKGGDAGSTGGGGDGEKGDVQIEEKSGYYEVPMAGKDVFSELEIDGEGEFVSSLSLD